MQRTYRCPCSVRALEAFVRDVAGLDIRQRRNNISFRNLSTRAPLTTRHSASQRLAPQSHAAIRSLDDAFVPFDTNSGLESLAADRDTAQAAPQSIEHESPEPFDPLEELEDPDSFDPEVVIHQDGAQSHLDSVLDGTQLNSSSSNQTIDAIFFPDLQAQPLHKAGQLHPQVQRLDMFPPEAKTPSQRRLERRIKRLEKEANGEEDVTATTTQKEPGKNARKKARRAAQALADQTSLDQETLDVAALITSATTPKQLSPGKVKKLEKRALFRKAAEEAAAKKAADKQAAEEALLRERNRNKERWQVEKAALEAKFGEQGWNPRKRISPDALAGIRALHAKSPETFSTPVLAEHFKVPPEAVRRILKSKWQPSEEEAEERRQRWEKRGEKKWTEMAEQGIKPPKKWRDRGVGKVGPGEVPPWKQPGKAGERWIETADADRFVVAGDIAADDTVDEYEHERDDFVDRIL